MRPFIDRYPPFLRSSPEFRDLQRALEPELLELWEARDSAMEQLCVETAGWGLEYWERTLGLPVEREKGLEARRSRVRAKLMGADVTTLALLERVAEIHTGIPAKVLEYPERFWVELAFSLNQGTPGNIEGLTETLREIMPAHLGWGFVFSLEIRGALRVGGVFGAAVRLGPPRGKEDLRSRQRLYMGGTLSARASLPVPADPALPSAATILRAGGVCTIISNLSKGE